MKRTILLTLLGFFSSYVLAQNNPYAVFGHKPKVEYKENRNDKLRIKNADISSSIKFIEMDFDKKVVSCYGAKDSLFSQTPFSNEILRWTTVDPLAEKYPGSSPYNYVDNNPILRIDPDGRDWIVSTSKNKDGKTQINLTYYTAVMNSSGKDIDMKNFMTTQQKAFEDVFGQGNVNAKLIIRQVSSSDQLNDFESLIDIQSGSNFKKNADGGFVGGDAQMGGKFLRLNADGIGENGILEDRKAGVHEIGHTGGLKHTFETGEKDRFVNGKLAPMELQGFYNSSNSPYVEANFMNYSSVAAKAGTLPPGINAISFFNKTVGKATRGQIQTIINNLYNGNLNYNNIPKRKR